jgi:hypothetical protein
VQHAHHLLRAEPTHVVQRAPLGVHKCSSYTVEGLRFRVTHSGGTGLTSVHGAKRVM